MTAENERAIISLLVRYATAVDRRDWQLFTTCFTRDIEANYRSFRAKGIDAFLGYMMPGHARLGPTLHRMMNFVVVGDDQHATATSYLDAVLTPGESGGPICQAHGWYEDRLVREADAWKISKRDFTSVLFLESSS